MAPIAKKINVQEICAHYYIIKCHVYYDKRRIHFVSQITKGNKTYFFTNNGSIYVAETKMEQNPLVMRLSKLDVDIRALENFNHVKKTSNKVDTCDVCKKISYTSSHTTIWRHRDKFHIGETSTPESNIVHLYLNLCGQCVKLGEEILNTPKSHAQEQNLKNILEFFCHL